MHNLLLLPGYTVDYIIILSRTQSPSSFLIALFYVLDYRTSIVYNWRGETRTRIVVVEFHRHPSFFYNIIYIYQPLDKHTI